eukprot:COSAG02_NODE_2678_length_8262_cov_5.072400_8_plen_80_part_00
MRILARCLDFWFSIVLCPIVTCLPPSPFICVRVLPDTIFWVISLSTDFVCLAFFLFFLPESMPDKLRKPIDRWDFLPLT